VVRTLEMPFEARPVDPRAQDVLAKIGACTEAMRTAESVRKFEAAKRAALITQARKYGVSLDVIAEVMGVTRQRARQIEAGQ
jgi:hypothetical protein